MRSGNEYKAARFLYDEYGVITFPAPSEIYDLITLSGIRIEVKTTPQLTKRQTLLGALDLFMIVFTGGWVFASQHEALSAVNLLCLNPYQKTIPRQSIQKWAKRKIETWQDVLDLGIQMVLL